MSAYFLKLGRGGKNQNIEDLMEEFEQYGGEAFSSSSSQHQDSSNLQDLDYIIVMDHEEAQTHYVYFDYYLALNPGRIAQAMKVKER